MSSCFRLSGQLLSVEIKGLFGSYCNVKLELGGLCQGLELAHGGSAISYLLIVSQLLILLQSASNHRTKQYTYMENANPNHGTKDSEIFQIFIVVATDDFSFILGKHRL